MDIRYRATAVERPRILLVEPSRSALAVMARRLSDHGYRVTTASCAASAIAELWRVRVDLILAELNMPTVTGAELARSVLGEVRWKDIPVILITGKKRPADAVKAYAAGAVDVVTKPFHFEVLLASIARRISAAKSVKRLREDNAALDARLVERVIEIGKLRDELLEKRSGDALIS